MISSNDNKRCEQKQLKSAFAAAYVRPLVTILAAFLATQGSVYGQQYVGDEEPKASKQRSALKTIEEEIGAPITVELDPITGTPSFIEAEILHSAKPDRKVSEESKLETARGFLTRYSEVLGIDDPTEEWSTASSEAGDFGQTHVRLTQQFGGIPVWPSELRIHLDHMGNVIAANGKYIRTPRGVNTKPAIGVRDAEARGLEAVPGDGGILEAGPQLILFVPEGGGQARLGWKMAFDVALDSHWIVIIDAGSGEVLTAFNRVCTANVLGSGVDEFQVHRPLSVWAADGEFFMYDTSKPMFDEASLTGWIGVFDARNTTTNDPWEVTSSDPNGWMLSSAVGAAFNLSETYDYYLEQHGRNSLDGSGGDMVAIVRYDHGFRNAFWNPQAQIMVFGDGARFASTLDVVAHELTHGVTSHESDLIYEGQSGALNEAMSDIFGELVEARTYGRNDWLMGAELAADGMGPLRSLSDPNSISTRFGPYPARMSQYVHTSEDYGGVHINSSIINHAFYLLAEGSNGAIGLEPAARIFYRANTVYLTSNSQFIDARRLIIRSAEDIYGADSSEAHRTAEAFDAVEIGGSIDDGNDNGDQDGDDDFEENDHLQGAAGISPGTLNLDGRDDDWFRFRVDGPSEVSISISGPEGDLDLYVLDVNGNVLGGSASGDSTESIVGQEAGAVECLIRVAPFEGQGGRYSLRLGIQPVGGGSTTDCGGLCGNGCAMAMFASFAGLLGFSSIGRRRGESGA